MEPAQQPSGIDQFAVPGQRTPPGQAAGVPSRQAGLGSAGAVPAQRTRPEPTGQLPGRNALPPRPRGRLRPVLAVLGGVLALFCLGGVSVGYLLYDAATAPDRSAPDVVVSNYLRAYLADRDDVATALFTCVDSSGLSPIRSLREDIEAREGRFGANFTVTWGSLTEVSQGDWTEVLVELKLSAVVDDFEQSDLQKWRFDTRYEDGWRVCGASRVG